MPVYTLNLQEKIVLYANVVVEAATPADACTEALRVANAGDYDFNADYDSGEGVYVAAIAAGDHDSVFDPGVELEPIPAAFSVADPVRAAAPELLAALKAACRDADAGLEHGDPYPSWYVAARAAIAKAEGR